MKRLLAALMMGLTVMIGLSTDAYADSIKAPIVIALWNDRSPLHSNNLPHDAEISDSSNRILNVTTPMLYVYPAEKPSGMAMLMCPGGGYGLVAIGHEGHDLAPLFNEMGITLAVLKYRMPNGHKDVPYEDACEALRILAERADELKIDPGKIGVGGASAGGHLASTLATHPCAGLPSLYFQVLLYPVISMEEGVTHVGSRENLLGKNPAKEEIECYSNHLRVSESTPPAFIAVSADDNGVPIENSLSYFEALNRKRPGSALHVYPVGGHGWGANPGFRFADQWRLELRSWLKGF